MLKKEHEIISVFAKTPWKRFTFKEIKKQTCMKSESYVYDALKKFVKLGLLKEEKAGNVVLYFLNLASLKARTYTGFVAEYVAWNKKHIPYKDIEKISKDIPTEFFVLIITGSYANKTHRRDSDLDMVIICDDTMDPKIIRAEISQECKLNIPPVHLYVFRKKEFLEMLTNKEVNYGKEIVKNNLILSGGKEYYGIIGEAMQNGFNG